jgi:hypothetical protein
MPGPEAVVRAIDYPLLARAMGKSITEADVPWQIRVDSVLARPGGDVWLKAMVHRQMLPLPRQYDLVRIELKRPFSDGTVAIDLDPLSLLCRLAASVPPPAAAGGSSCVRWSSRLTISSVCCVTSGSLSNRRNERPLGTLLTSNLKRCGASSQSSTKFLRGAALDPRLLAGWVMRRFVKKPSTVASAPVSAVAQSPTVQLPHRQPPSILSRFIAAAIVIAQPVLDTPLVPPTRSRFYGFSLA